MRVALTVVAPTMRRTADVLLEAEPATTMADIAAELAFTFVGNTMGPYHGGGQQQGARVLRFPGPGAHGPLALSSPLPGAEPLSVPLYVNHCQIPPQLSLAQAGIRDGAVISLGDPAGCVSPEQAGLVEVRATGGPMIGAIWRLGAGQWDVGSGHGAVRLGDPAVPAAALRIFVDGWGRCQVAPYEGAGAAVDREPLMAPAQWHPGQTLAVGNSLLRVAPYEPPDAALRPSPDGSGLDFNRPPRLLRPERATRFQLPAPPSEADRRPLPILMAALPLVMGVAMAFLLHQAYLLAMAGLSPLMLVGGYFSERSNGRKSRARQMLAYREHKLRVERDARLALEEERADRDERFPDPAAVFSIASGPRRRLWERRQDDPDYLLLRVGTADLASAVTLTDPELDEHRRDVTWLVPDAPVTIALRQRGVIGVAGSGDAPRAIGRWLVAQTATLHSPSDVQICLLADSSGEDSWEWTRWLPHCRPLTGQDCSALIGNDAESVAARIAELLAIISARQQAAGEAGRQEVRFRLDIIVVLDGSRRLRSLPGVIQLLRDGPGMGVYAACLDADERLLPAECQAVVVAEPDGLRVQQAMTDGIRHVRPDAAQPGWCLPLARSIAPIRDVSDSDEASALPDTSRLLDVLEMEPPAAAVIAARWRGNGRSTSAVLGESYDGPFGIDLRKDGPHALIAGTTGSGKSELLQTVVASLAIANRPDEMTFVLVDYKGGSAFADCVQLPHTVGMVTDLDPHQVERALASLSAELTRREHMLAAAGAKDIEDYQQLVDKRQARPLPRLVLVIDEFASMVRDLPDFISGLVNIAQRGRSLGIHLILATQRPSGVVSADIRANTNLRIALRVTDAAESADVIGAPDAASISKATPGRAYVRLGHGSLVPFQTGRVGGRRPEAEATTITRPRATPLSWSALGRPEPSPPDVGRRDDQEITDLKILVEQIQYAAQGLRVPRQPSPWLPPLPPLLQLAGIVHTGHRQQPGNGPSCAYGMTDLPLLQQQQPTALNLDTFSHLMAAGAPRSGRSQLLRTIAASLALGHSCADVHLYGIDCGSGALGALTELPHCGAVVNRSQTERATRLLKRLAGELSRRQELLAASGCSSVNEQRAAAPEQDWLPRIVILLDRWEGFTTSLGELDNGGLTEIITRILSERASAGMHLVMTGDRSLLGGRISTLCEEKLAFKLPDKEDYALIGLRPRDLPDHIPPGRAFHAGSGSEMQVSLLGPDASGPGQAAALQAVAVQCRSRDHAVPAGQRPFRVDLLPPRISYAQAWQLRPPSAGPLWGLVGVGGDTLAALGPDLASGVPCFIVAGPAKSGRSTILLSMASSLLAAGTPVVLVAPRPSPLRSLASAPGVRRLFDSSQLGAEELIQAQSTFDGRGVVLVDDAELLRDCDAGAELSRLIAFGGDTGRALVFAGDSESIGLGFSGWQVDAKRARRGCLTAPATLPEGDLIGVRLPRGLIGQPPSPGRCLLHLGDGNPVTVTVPGQ